jgi:hypothetical protein
MSVKTSRAIKETRLANTCLYVTHAVFYASHTVELHLSGIIGTARYPDMQKIRISGFSLKVGYIGSLKRGKKILQTAVLGYIFIY